MSLPPCSGLISSWKWSDCLETSCLSAPKTCMSSSGAGPAHFLPHSCLTAWPPTTDVIRNVSLTANRQVAPASAPLYLPSAQRSSPARSLGQYPLKDTCSDHFVFSTSSCRSHFIRGAFLSHAIHPVKVSPRMLQNLHACHHIQVQTGLCFQNKPIPVSLCLSTARAAPTLFSVLVDMSVLEPSMNRVRQHVAFMMGLFHLAYLPGSAGLYLGLRFYSLYGRWRFHCMGMPHLGPIYPDRSSKENFCSGWLACHCRPPLCLVTPR